MKKKAQSPEFPPDRNYPDYIERTFDFRIPSGQRPERLDTFLTQAIPNASRTKVQEAIDAGNVTVNGQPGKASRKVQPGDNISCRVMKPPPLQLLPENIPLDILHEDAHVLVINKPAGMVVHPGFGNRYGTLVNAVLWHLGLREAIDIETGDEEGGESTASEGDEEESGQQYIYGTDAIRPGIVHRLDKDTSGILVIAKNSADHAALADQFDKRTVQREYNTIVWGVVKEDHGFIEGNIGRSPRDRKLFTVVPKGGKTALSEYTVLERYDYASLLKLKLHTGRTHQIRVHCAHIGHPVVGDSPYGGGESAVRGIFSQYKPLAEKIVKVMQRQALHARTLGFTHPVTRQWMEFTSPLPEDFEEVLKILRGK